MMENYGHEGRTSPEEKAWEYLPSSIGETVARQEAYNRILDRWGEKVFQSGGKKEQALLKKRKLFLIFCKGFFRLCSGHIYKSD